MKTLGLLGGTTWVSTLEYYRLINQGINQKMGGLNAARCILFSLNMEDVQSLKRKKNEDGLTKLILDAVSRLLAAGIDGLVLCANTLHFAVPQISEKFDVPIIHIARATAEAIRQKKLETVGLLGTRQTMEQHFYTDVLNAEGIRTLVPETEERKYIDWVIFNELSKEQFHEHTRNKFLQIINDLRKRGAKGIILGCTEIPLLIHAEHTGIPLFNTLEIHARAAVDFAVE